VGGGGGGAGLSLDRNEQVFAEWSKCSLKMSRNGGKHPRKGDTRSCIVRLASSASLYCHSLGNNMSKKRFQVQTVQGSGTQFVLVTKFVYFF